MRELTGFSSVVLQHTLTTGTSDDFSNLNILLQNLRCRKRNSSAFQRNKFQLDLSRNGEVTGVQSRAVCRQICHRHYRQRSGSTAQAAWFSTLTMVHLHVHYWHVTGRHITTGAWWCKDPQICFFSPCSSHKHWPSFLVCLDKTRKNPCTEKSWLERFRKTLAMGELSRDQVQLLSIRIHSGLSRGQLRCRGDWFEDRWTCWPNDGHPSISCTACCVAFTDFVVGRLQRRIRSSVLAKKSSGTPR